MDQNTATIIASTIAVIGTLGGAITGVLLSNNHTSKMEKLRIEQDKAKQNVAVIEEAFSLLIQIENQIFKKVVTIQKAYAVAKKRGNLVE